MTMEFRDTLSISDRYIYDKFIAAISDLLENNIGNLPPEIDQLADAVIEICYSVVMFYNIYSKTSKTIKDVETIGTVETIEWFQDNQSTARIAEARFDHCDMETLLWIRDAIPNFHNWTNAICTGLPKEHYRTVLDWYTEAWRDGKFAKHEHVYDWGDTYLFVRLREELSWEEIADYFGFTRKRYCRLCKPANDQKNTQYYRDYLAYVNEGHDLVTFKWSEEQLMEGYLKPIFDSHFDNGYVNTEHIPEEIPYVSRMPHEICFPDIQIISLRDFINKNNPKLLDNAYERMSYAVLNMELKCSYKYAIMTIKRHIFIDDLVELIIRSYMVFVTENTHISFKDGVVHYSLSTIRPHEFF